MQWGFGYAWSWDASLLILGRFHQHGKHASTHGQALALSSAPSQDSSACFLCLRTCLSRHLTHGGLSRTGSSAPGCSRPVPRFQVRPIVAGVCTACPTSFPLNNNPFHRCTTFCFLVGLLMNIWVVSISWLFGTNFKVDKCFQFSLMAREAGRLKSRCGQGHTISEGLGRAAGGPP